MDNENGATREPSRMRIPEEYRSGFTRLSKLEDEPFQKLLAVIEEEPPALYYMEFSGRVARKISNIDSNDMGDIIETLVSLHGVRASWNLEIPELAELVTQAAAKDAELELADEERERLEGRLVLLLEVDSLDATSKALDVLLESEHTLHDARIITDVRPVFGRNAEKPPTGVMIVHTLKLSYHDESEEVKDLYVAMGAGDIGALNADLDRANQKAESLRRMLEPTGVPYIDAE